MYAAATTRELFRKLSLVVARNQQFVARRLSDVGSSSPTPDCTTDVGVVGGGVVGVAVAAALAKSGRSVWLFEQNSLPGQESTSRNSEVIHAGIYYNPGSLKAQLCVRGKRLLYKYVQEHNIAHKQLGKVIVCSEPWQLEQLEQLQNRARQNGVTDCVLLSGAELERLEPALKSCGGMLSPSTGIVDSHGVMECLQGELQQAGAEMACNVKVVQVDPQDKGLMVRAQDVQAQGDVHVLCRTVVNCAGLHAHRVVQSVKGFPMQHVPRVWYAKGNYFTIPGRSPFSRLIYPMPGDGGLGTHLTLDLAGQMRFGPDVEWLDHTDPAQIDYHVSPEHAAIFARNIQAYWPEVPASALQAAYAGVRAKLSGPGQKNADFLVQGPDVHSVPGLINCFGIESPGLTSALALAEHVQALIDNEELR